MAIAKKPGSNQAKTPEAKAEQFISGAANPQPAPTTTAPGEGDDGKRKPAMIRFDPALLARVDAAARRRGISRSAWVQYTLSRVLDDEGV